MRSSSGSGRGGLNRQASSQGSATYSALPVRGRKPGRAQAHKRLNMKEPGRCVFRLRLFFGPDGKQTNSSLCDGAARPGDHPCGSIEASVQLVQAIL
jgi:hypothetical protein